MIFRDKYWFLSNFYPVEIECAGLKFKCVESAFQAYKCANIEDRKLFVNLNGAEAKKLGRKVPMRKDWEDIKVKVMYRLVMQKFNRNPELLNRLKDIKGIIVEDNTWNDTFWGMCNGKGRNTLGVILTAVRNELSASK